MCKSSVPQVVQIFKTFKFIYILIVCGPWTSSIVLTDECTVYNKDKLFILTLNGKEGLGSAT